MNSYFVHGTLGDTFIVTCKLYNMGYSHNIFHKTEHKYWYPPIEELYSLISLRVNKLEFTEDIRDDLEELTSDCHEGDMEFFPLFDIWNRFRWIETPYHVLQPHSGKPEGYNSKKFNIDTINKIISNNKDKRFVLLGTDKQYLTVGNCINLIGKTNIKEAISIIYRSDGFIGPEGLLSFLSLSNKKPSTIYYASQEAVDKRIINTPWEQYANLIKAEL